MFTVLFTATVVNPDTEEEFHGFISPKWNMRELRSEPSDVETIVFDTREEAETYIEETIGTADSFDGEDWHAADSKMDLETGENWSYHARVAEEF